MKTTELKILIDDFRDRLVAYIDSGKPRHGRIVNPKSRAVYLNEQKLIDAGQMNEVEGGKGFPGTTGGYVDPAADSDVLGKAPPHDGLIASGGHTDERIKLNSIIGGSIDWPKHAVSSNSNLTVEWNYSMPHKTRRWTYWITKEGWNTREPLSREHLEKDPIKTVVNEYKPYWGPEAAEKLIAKNPTIHEVPLPQRTGRHLLLAVWNVADTAAAFYQVIDLDFSTTP